MGSAGMNLVHIPTFGVWMILFPSLPPFPSLPLSYFFSHVQRDLAALEKQVALLSQEAKRLSNTYPERSSHVRKREQQTVSSWKALIEKSKGRKNKLVEAEQLQRFLNEFRDIRWYFVIHICITCSHPVQSSPYRWTSNVVFKCASFGSHAKDQINACKPKQDGHN